MEQQQQRAMGDDRWSSLKAYRRSKGLCFICGERWARDHQCKTAVQLHIVQEMLECLQQDEQGAEDDCDVQHVEPPQMQQLLSLSSAALNTDVSAPRTLQLLVHIQGHKFLFLVDSGSSSCFIDQHKAELLTGCVELPVPVPVKVAGGAI
jgi:hypothetical protein